MERGALPFAGPMACGCLWVIATVNINSRSSAVVSVTQMAVFSMRNQSWRVLVWMRGAARGWAAGPAACGGLWAMARVDSISCSAIIYVDHT